MKNMSENRALTPFQMRLLFLGLLTSLCVVAVGGRLFYLMVTMRETLQERADIQHQYTLKLEARRGTIRDRHGRQLATSVEVESVYAVPKAFPDALLTDASQRLSTCLSASARRISARLAGERRSHVWFAAFVSSTWRASAFSTRAGATIRSAAWRRTFSDMSASTMQG